MDIENYNVSESPKVANVRPIYKKKSKNGLENYRPLLLLNTFSKIYESLIKIFTFLPLLMMQLLVLFPGTVFLIYHEVCHFQGNY